MIAGSSRLRGHTVSTYSYDFSGDVRIWVGQPGQGRGERSLTAVILINAGAPKKLR